MSQSSSSCHFALKDVMRIASSDISGNGVNGGGSATWMASIITPKVQ